MCHCQSQNQGCCGSQASHSGASSCGCQCHSSAGKHGECDYPAKFLELEDQEWMEVLKEKIKEHIKSDAKHMDELARLVSEANKERWSRKMANKQVCCNYEDKLKHFFSAACESGQKCGH